MRRVGSPPSFSAHILGPHLHQLYEDGTGGQDARTYSAIRVSTIKVIEIISDFPLLVILRNDLKEVLCNPSVAGMVGYLYRALGTMRRIERLYSVGLYLLMLSGQRNRWTGWTIITSFNDGIKSLDPHPGFLNFFSQQS